MRVWHNFWLGHDVIYENAQVSTLAQDALESYTDIEVQEWLKRIGMKHVAPDFRGIKGEVWPLSCLCMQRPWFPPGMLFEPSTVYYTRTVVVSCVRFSPTDMNLLATWETKGFA